MLKFLHVVAIGALISSAVYAYSIKYETTFAAEELQKIKKRALKERDSIAVLRAECTTTSPSGCKPWPSGIWTSSHSPSTRSRASLTFPCAARKPTP